MVYKPKHFELYELVPKSIYETSNHPNLWFLFDDLVLWTIDRLQETYGKCFVNDWYWGGSNEYGGWRPPEVKLGALFSQHKFGRALDLKFEKYPAEKIREDIRANPKAEIFQHIHCIEKDVPWLHFDRRNWLGELLEVNP